MVMLQTDYLLSGSPPRSNICANGKACDPSDCHCQPDASPGSGQQKPELPPMRQLTLHLLHLPVIPPLSWMSLVLLPLPVPAAELPIAASPAVRC